MANREKKRGTCKCKSLNISRMKKSFFCQMKNICFCFWKATVRWKNKKLMKIADTIFKLPWDGSANIESFKLHSFPKFWYVIWTGSYFRCTMILLAYLISLSSEYLQLAPNWQKSKATSGLAWPLIHSNVPICDCSKSFELLSLS